MSTKITGKKRKAIIPVGVIMKKQKLGKKSNIFFDRKRFPLYTKKALTDEITLVALGVDTTNANKVVSLNAMVQGNTELTRIGTRIRCKSIQWSYRLKPRYGSLVDSTIFTNTPPATRISIVWDKNPNGVKPLYFDAGDTKNSVFNGHDPWDLPLFSNSERFNILYTEVITPKDVSEFFQATSGTIGYFSKDWVETRDGYRKLSLITNYNDGNAGDSTDIAQGGLFLMMTSEYSITTAGNNTNNSVSMQGDFKLRFEDV